MVKRLFLISLTCLYTLLSIGVSVRAHYCHGELAWMQVNKIGTTGCCSDMPPRDGRCCDDEHIEFQLDVDQQVVQDNPFQINDLEKLSLPDPAISFDDQTTAVYYDQNPGDRAPPPPADIRLMICSLTYYG